jgi:hypothetical protein
VQREILDFWRQWRVDFLHSWRVYLEFIVDSGNKVVCLVIIDGRGDGLRPWLCVRQSDRRELT